jgi:glycosyltransferase involved in cell wall biosynthesis
MPMPPPDSLITVVIPVFNGERYIAAAIDSVLSQSSGSFEIIVVDDGSTDQTRRVVERFCGGVRYEYQPNAGPSAARNRGIERATGELVAFLDADDLWHQNKTATQLVRFAERAELVGCAAHVQNFLSSDLESAAEQPRNSSIIEQNAVTLGSTFMAQRLRFDAVGPLNTAYQHCDLQDLIVRANDAGYSTEILPDVLAQRRIHADNLSHNRSEADRRELVAIAHARHARRRATGL